MTHNPARDALPDWSPDGKQIAFQSNRDGNWEIYVMNADGAEQGSGDQRRLTDNDAADESPNWSPDGTRIAFNSDRDGNAEIYVVDVATGYLRRLTDNSSGEWQPAWSPSPPGGGTGGTQIAFCSDRDGNVEIYVANVDGAEQGSGNQR